MKLRLAKQGNQIVTCNTGLGGVCVEWLNKDNGRHKITTFSITISNISGFISS